MSDYALWMGHNPSGGGGEVLERMRNSIITTISQRTGMTTEDVGAMLDKETYMDAQECLNANFCDRVQATNSINVKRVSQAASITDKWKEATTIVNSLLPTDFNKQIIKPSTMADTKISASITNKLGLHEAASDVMVVEAVEAIQNKLTVSETNLKVAENKAKKSDEEMAAMRTKCENLQAELDSYKSMMEEAEEENRMMEATNMVKGFAELGKINNDEATIKFYVNTATAGKNKDEKAVSFKATETLLTNMVVNKKAETIKVVNTQVGAATNSVALTMARIAKAKGQI